MKNIIKPILIIKIVSAIALIVVPPAFGSRGNVTHKEIVETKL